jgi:hypothetical protein
MRFMMIMFPKEYLNAKPGWAPDLKAWRQWASTTRNWGKRACCWRSTG